MVLGRMGKSQITCFPATKRFTLIYPKADNVGALVNGCIAPGITKGGDCKATNGLWEMAYVLLLVLLVKSRNLPLSRVSLV